MKRKLTIFLLAVLVAAGLFYHELIAYGWVQLQGQIKLIRSAISVEEALSSEEYTIEEKEKLRLIQHVRIWADSALHLNVGNSYTTVIRQDATSTMHVVTAAYPLELKSYQWSYGPVGEMAYKGFFDEALAKEELQRMREQGFDTDLGKAGGWSTLGILDDPILSGMLKRDSTSLIDLIIHESLHATVFRWGETEWNENLATVVAEVGMEQFVKNELKDADLFERYLEKKEQRSIRRLFIHAKALELDTLYQSWEMQDLENAERHILKQKWMEGFKKDYLSLSGLSEWPRHKPLNNTLFTDFLNYRSSNDSMKLVLKNEFDNDIPAFLESLK